MKKLIKLKNLEIKLDELTFIGEYGECWKHDDARITKAFCIQELLKSEEFFQAICNKYVKENSPYEPFKIHSINDREEVTYDVEVKVPCYKTVQVSAFKDEIVFNEDGSLYWKSSNMLADKVDEWDIAESPDKIDLPEIQHIKEIA